MTQQPESEKDFGVPPEGDGPPGGRIAWTDCPLAASAVGEPGQPILRAGPEQMMGSKSRMQGKVMSERRASEMVAVGIDVCKDWLDIHILPSSQELRLANGPKGFQRLVETLKPLSVVIVVVEATSKFHRGVHRFLHRAGLEVSVVNPLRSRLFAESIGELAKTDRVDARMLAVYGQTVALPVTPPLPEALENLKEITRSRNAATAARTALQNQLESAALPGVKRNIARQIKSATKAIEDFDAMAMAIVKADPALAGRFDILVSIPGVGAVTALGWLANMPELGSLDAKQAGMLAGLAPIACDSGKRNAPRRIRGGREEVRTGTYMSALSATRHNPSFKAFYDRLLAAGKPAKLAITAVMRKLIVLANSLLKEARKWSKNPPLEKPLAT